MIGGAEKYYPFDNLIGTCRRTNRRLDRARRRYRPMTLESASDIAEQTNLTLCVPIAEQDLVVVFVGGTKTTGAAIATDGNVSTGGAAITGGAPGTGGSRSTPVAGGLAAQASSSGTAKMA